MSKPDIFVDVTCPKCGSVAGNGGCGDVFSCPYCGWRGEIDGVSNDMMTVEEILQQHRQRNREGNA